MGKSDCLGCFLCSMCICLCISAIFFGIGAHVYNNVEAHNEARCTVDDITLKKHTCEDVCTTVNNVRTCTYKDCWSHRWLVTISAETLSNDQRDWIISSRRYDNKDTARKKANWRSVDNTYDCWYYIKDDEPEATWSKPDHTGTIVLFCFGAAFALPPALSIVALIFYGLGMGCYFIGKKYFMPFLEGISEKM